MAFIIADRVAETTETTGTGAFNLAGPVTGFQSFLAGVGDGNETFYAVTDNTDWEVGIGTVTSGSPDTLSRDTVLKSTNSDAAVNWGAGTKDVFLSVPADRLPTLNGDNTFSGNNTFSGSLTLPDDVLIDSLTAEATIEDADTLPFYDDSEGANKKIVRENFFKSIKILSFDDENDKGNLGTSATIDWSTGQMQFGTLNDNVTLTFSNPIPGRYSLRLEQDATGGRTITWPTGIKWANGVEPDLDDSANSESIITFEYRNSTYYGAYLTAFGTI